MPITSMPKIIFWGTPEFANVILRALLDSGINIEAAVTAPDKPKGRSKQPVPSPVKVTAQRHGIKLFQPQSLKDPHFAAELAAASPDLMVIAAYGKIVPQSLIDIPELGVINVHPSLLPKYRGASPVVTALLNGETVTGVTLILLDKEVDHGPILAQKSYPVSLEDTQESLHTKLADLSGQMLVETLPMYWQGLIKPHDQDHNQATFTKVIDKDNGKINWHDDAEKIARQVRAYYGWPSSWSIIQSSPVKQLLGKKIYIHRAAPVTSAGLGPGEMQCDGEKIYIGTGKGGLEVYELQLESRNKISANQFVRGYHNLSGTILQ